MQEPHRTVSWYAIMPAIIAGVAVVTPALLYSVPALGFALQLGFALVCHQRAERSFFLFGGSIAVCARCLGIYLGATMGLSVHVSRRVAMRLLIAVAAMSAADWLAELTNLHGNWMLVRFAMGIALGTAGAMMVVASLKTPTQAKTA
jgi:uncharacterized membrane protein